MTRERIIRLISHRHFVLVCLALSAGLRLLWISLVRAPQVYDWIWYYERAVSMASGHGYYVNGVPTAYWPVGYPGFLAGIFYVVGPHVTAGKLANIAEWLGTIVLTYAFVKDVFRSEISARIAAFILCFHPNSIAYTALLTADMFLAFLMMLGAVIFVRARERWSFWVLAGIVWGVAALTKPQAIFVPAIFLLLFHYGRRSMFKAGALVYLMIIAVLVPWVVRNDHVFGKPVLSTNGGTTLLVGNNPYATGRDSWDARLYTTLGDLAADEDHMFDGREVARDARARQVALNYMEHHPLQDLSVWPKKFRALYLSDVEGFYFTLGLMPYSSASFKPIYLGLRLIGELYYLAMIALLLVAVPVVARSGNWIYSVGFFIAAYFTLVYLVFLGDPRYHFAFIPWIAMYSGIGAAYLLSPKLVQLNRAETEHQLSNC